MAHLFEQLTGFLKDPDSGGIKTLTYSRILYPISSTEKAKRMSTEKWPKLSEMVPLKRTFLLFSDGVDQKAGHI